ncbi:MAG: hypothetical protein R2742_15090 [Micropruina glycogenica]
MSQQIIERVVEPISLAADDRNDDGRDRGLPTRATIADLTATDVPIKR